MTAVHPIVINGPVDERLLDKAVDAYVDWREERAQVWDAYQRWASAADGDAPFAFSAYRAALDREEHASHVYADQMMQIDAAMRDPEPVAAARRLFPW